MRVTILLFLTLVVQWHGFTQPTQKVQPALPVLNNFDKIRDFTLSRNGNEAYFTVQSATEEVSVICSSTRVDDNWTAPEIVSFSGIYKDLEPFLAPDNLKLYFVSARPLNDSIKEPKDMDIWFVERSNIEATWSPPKNLGSPVNTEQDEFYPAIAKNGNLYFTSTHPDFTKGRDDILFSAFDNGHYQKPVSLDSTINTAGFEYNAYVSQNEDYLLFGGYQRPDGLGSGDIYISFTDEVGNWTKAIPLPEPVNSRYMDFCPFVDEKNNILYFTSRRSALPDVPISTIGELMTFLNAYENGRSRLYKYQIELDELKK